MSVALEQKQGLIAGDGHLPVKMAQYAKDNGFDVIAISLSNDNYSQLSCYLFIYFAIIKQIFDNVYH